MEDEAKLMRDKLTERFDRMMKVLFRQEGANLEIGILASEEAQDFIEAHSSVLNGSFRKVEMSETMRKRLERSNYVFSGLKTFHELNEAFPSLLDENGNRKTFERLSIAVFIQQGGKGFIQFMEGLQAGEYIVGTLQPLAHGLGHFHLSE